MRLYPPCADNMVASNILGYWEPRVHSPPANSANAMTNFVISEEVDTTILRLCESIDICDSRGHIFLSIVSIVYGRTTKLQSRPMTQFHRNYVPVFASLLVSYKWGVFRFNSGHFVSTIQTHNIPFEIDLAADTSPNGCALFKQFTGCPSVVDSSDSLLKLIQSSVETSSLHLAC